MPIYPHKLLQNPSGSITYFDGSRGFGSEEDDRDEKEEFERNYTRQKASLQNNLNSYSSNIAEKYQNRNIEVPADIDYVRIDFLVTFADTIEWDTKTYFTRNFGIHPIQYYNFNKSALFEISNRQLFRNFLSLVQQFVSSRAQTTVSGQPYARVTLIQRFELLTREVLLRQQLREQGLTSSVVLQLTHSDRSTLEIEKSRIESSLVDYLQTISLAISINYRLEGDFLSINGLTEEYLIEIVDNFDLIASVQSIRIPRVHLTAHGATLRNYDFTIDIATGTLPLVVVIDNGINRIPPLDLVLENSGYTFDLIYPPYRPNGWHGTAVAVLTATGESFYHTPNRALTTYCKVISYRVFENEGGAIDFIAFETNIRAAAAYGVKLFNLSLNIDAKPYNGDYSFFGFLLDRLAYELQVLFFVSAGNLDPTDLYTIYDRMQTPPYAALLDYPAHYFSPDEFSPEHSCVGTNLKVPGESLNNLTVGAIAENFNEGTSVDISLDKLTPAYYTSKYHVSSFHKVNGSRLKTKHINFRINKPDIVYPGGDYGVESAGIQVVGSGIGNDFYRQECGTSFSTPFATNLAARIAHKYPTISAQSIKALIINSSSPTAPSGFLEAHLNRLKEKYSLLEFGKELSALNRSEKLKINKWFHQEDLLKKLVGHGKPDSVKALSSNDKTITVVLEDSIRINTHKAIPIKLPNYLNAFTSIRNPIVTIDATLCFSFKPDFTEQTGYNPLHISFNFIKTFDNPGKTAKVAAYRRDPDDGSLTFYTALHRGAIDAKERNNLRKIALGVKTNLETWSDDFYPNIRQFSNCQKLTLNVNVNDLNKVGNDLSLIVRCKGKNDAGFDLQSYLDEDHPFSIVLTFSEQGKNQFRGIDFYEQFIALNQTADIIAPLEAEADDLEADV
ncbi:MAG: S8 family peptidase [Bacteroidetes bacterium]|nr:S8 family peptidase [Bacteroidota bacterium]MBU1371557.1 S8 family peptidase [Bacteroidota bacterium]MBU1486139.1 S8 family peptidase [Bacteroidota bacterium]MBU1759564.1 S8 family peptidase [Bacteroidota bacterium]MBU2045921.1 S8 family peptidase [Bacteroidota bacterium]